MSRSPTPPVQVRFLAAAGPRASSRPFPWPRLAVPVGPHRNLPARCWSAAAPVPGALSANN